MRPQAVVIGASHRGERSQGVILWRSQITASHVLTADTRITLAVPLPPSVHYDAHLSSPLQAERDEAGSIVAFVATDVIVHNVTIALSQPVAGAWVVLAAPIVRGNVVQRVVVVEGHDVLQFSPDRALPSVEHVGWMSLGGLEHRDKSVCDALHDGPGVLPQVGGLYLRAESLDPAGLRGELTSSKERAGPTAALLVLVFIAVVVALLAAYRTLARRGREERAEAQLDEEFRKMG